MSIATKVRFDPFPKCWEVQKVGDVCMVGTGGTPDTKFPEYYEPATINWIKSGDVKGFYIQSAAHRISEAGMQNSAATPHPRGTVLMAMSGRGKTRATTAILDIEAACSQSVAAVIPNGSVTSEFLHFQFVHRYSEIRAITGDEDRSGLNMSLIRNIDLILPPVPEQRKIAGVLGLVQRAIEQQERLLALTAELKKSLLHQLFTRGLRNESPKHTELGPIPQSWDLLEIGALGRVVTGSTPKTKVPEYYHPPDIDFIAPADLGVTRDIYNSEKKISREGLGTIRALPTPSVMCVCIGSSIGKVGMTVKPESATNQQINSIICDKSHNAHFIYYLLHHFASYWRGFATFGPVPILSKGIFETIKICVPPTKAEEEGIAEVLMAVDSKAEIHMRKQASLSALFCTLLHEFMTARIRVHELDLPELDAVTKE